MVGRLHQRVEKLIEHGATGEIAVRLHHLVGGSAYNFVEKFGAYPEDISG